MHTEAMDTEAKGNKEHNKSSAISQPSSQSATNEWLLKRVGKTLQSYPMISLDRGGIDHLVDEWALILAEVGEERFDQVLAEHIRESKFFPAIAELRGRAGMSKADRDSAEALGEWVKLKRFVDRNYYEDLGGLHNADKIPRRVQYALRAVGGARAIYFMDLESEPFKRKDFIEAYRLAPIHEQMEQARLGTTLAWCLEEREPARLEAPPVDEYVNIGGIVKDFYEKRNPIRAQSLPRSNFSEPRDQILASLSAGLAAGKEYEPKVVEEVLAWRQTKGLSNHVGEGGR